MQASIEIQVFSQQKLLSHQILTEPDIHFGRDKRSTIQLSGFSVAKHHASLSYRAGAWQLQDLSTISGTFLDGQRVVCVDKLGINSLISISHYQIKIIAINADSNSNSNSKQMQTLRLSSLQTISRHSTQQEAIDQSFAALDVPVVAPVVASRQTLPMDKLSTANQPSHQVNYSCIPVLKPAQDSPGPDQEFEHWRERLQDSVVTGFDLRRTDIRSLSQEELQAQTLSFIDEQLQNWQKDLPTSLDKMHLRQVVLDDVTGLGPLEELLNDPAVSEIMVNSPSEIFIEKNGQIQRSTLCFTSDSAVLAVIEKIVAPLGRRIDQASPMVDGRLKDGSRVNAIIPPLAVKGPCLTIRKFPAQQLGIHDLVQVGSMDQAMAAFFAIAVREGRNILVSGGTGTGKTTLLNVLSNLIPSAERVITIEDAAELRLNQPDLVSLEAKPAGLDGLGAISIRDLVRNALRMRPDRIVVGECRGPEALDMLQAMNTGHDGSLTTLHANTPRDALSRLEVMVLTGSTQLPISAIREQVNGAIDIIVQQTRFACGARKITQVSEVVGIESGTIQMQDIFRFKRTGLGPDRRVQGFFHATGHIPSFYEQLQTDGQVLDLSPFVGTEDSV